MNDIQTLNYQTPVCMLINMAKLLLKVTTTAKIKMTCNCWDDVTNSKANQKIVT